MMAAHNWPINGWLPFKDLLTGHIRDQQGPVITQILLTQQAGKVRSYHQEVIDHRLMPDEAKETDVGR